MFCTFYYIRSHYLQLKLYYFFLRNRKCCYTNNVRNPYLLETSRQAFIKFYFASLVLFLRIYTLNCPMQNIQNFDFPGENSQFIIGSCKASSSLPVFLLLFLFFLIHPFPCLFFFLLPLHCVYPCTTVRGHSSCKYQDKFVTLRYCLEFKIM